MRARDVRAIVFCITTTAIVLVVSYLLLDSKIVSPALALAYGVFLLTRPRVQRVIRRLRGEPDWSGYFDNSGTRFRPPPVPGTAPGSPRPVERP